MMICLLALRANAIMSLPLDSRVQIPSPLTIPLFSGTEHAALRHASSLLGVQPEGRALPVKSPVLALSSVLGRHNAQV